MLKIQQVRTWCIFHAVSYNLENAVDVFIPPSSILTSQWRAGNEFHETSFRLPVKQLFQNNFHSFCVKDESFRFIVSCGAILYSEASTQLFNSYCVNHVNNNEKVWYKIQPGWILNFHAWYQVDDIIMFKAEARTKKLLFFIFFKFWNILWFNCYPFANLVNISFTLSCTLNIERRIIPVLFFLAKWNLSQKLSCNQSFTYFGEVLGRALMSSGSP